MQPMKYRPEIDGLRAIAVLSVVFYHADMGPSAGFVGVDVFFVISGYLITALLYREWLTTGRVDMSAFYARRFRRLFAALAFVVISTVIFSALVLSPYSEIQQVTRSAAASLVFVSNFFFQMTTGGYFDDSTDLLPLLHLWSLAVEEQFYVIWPILLVIVLRLRPTLLIPTLMVLCVSSFVLAELLIVSNPQAAFYQMPARFWELAVGGLIALSPPGRVRDGRAAAYSSLAILLAAVLVAPTHFPGIGVLAAVTGAALLLHAVHGTTELGKAGAWLRSRPMVFVGLISYSLYLWHWPLLAIDKATRAGPSPPQIRVLLCAIAIVIAWFSYRFVEQPFRRADPATSTPRVIAAGLTASFALALAAISLGDFLHRDPLPTDLASKTSRDMPANRFDCHYRGDESLDVFPKPDCDSVPDKPVRVVIWGDSMALAWQPFSWKIAEMAGAAATSYTRDACPPVHNFANGKRLAEDMLCRQFNSLVLEKLGGIDTLILAASWSSYPRQSENLSADTDLNTRLRETIQLVARRVNKIIVLGPTPTLRDTAPRCIRTASLDACAVSRKKFDEKAAASRALLSLIAADHANLTYLARILHQLPILPEVWVIFGLDWVQGSAEAVEGACSAPIVARRDGFGWFCGVSGKAWRRAYLPRHRGGGERGLSAGQATRHQEVQILVGAGTGEQEPHAAGIAQDHRTDLEQLQADRTHIGVRQRGAFQADAPDRLDQRVGQ